MLINRLKMVLPNYFIVTDQNDDISEKQISYIKDKCLTSLQDVFGLLYTGTQVTGIRFLIETGSENSGSDNHTHDGLALDKNYDLSKLDTFKMFIQHGANIHIKEGLPLRWAAENGHLDIVRYLTDLNVNTHVGNKLDIHIRDGCALKWASRNGHSKIVEHLIHHNANVHVDEDCPLRWSSEYGHFDVVECLVKHKANVNAMNNYSLQWAIIGEHFEIIEFLINNGADIHCDNDVPLKIACKKGSLQLVKKLMILGANINVNFNPILTLSVKKGHLEIVKYLIDNSLNINVEYDNLIKLALIKNHFEIKKYLKNLKKKQLPAKKEHIDIMKLVISSGVDLNVEQINSIKLASSKNNLN